MRVVDLLEAVEVDEQHGGAPPRALGVGQRLVDAVDEQRAVGQPGQRVVGGLHGRARPARPAGRPCARPAPRPSRAISRSCAFWALRSVKVRQVRSSPSTSSGEHADQHRHGVAVAVDEVELDGRAEAGWAHGSRRSSNGTSPATNIASGEPTIVSRARRAARRAAGWRTGSARSTTAWPRRHACSRRTSGTGRSAVESVNTRRRARAVGDDEGVDLAGADRAQRVLGLGHPHQRVGERSSATSSELAEALRQLDELGVRANAAGRHRRVDSRARRAVDTSHASPTESGGVGRPRQVERGEDLVGVRQVADDPANRERLALDQRRRRQQVVASARRSGPRGRRRPTRW